MNFKEVDIQTIRTNPFTLIGDEWMLITAGTKAKCNTMTASWGGVGVIWNKNVATIYIRPTRYTKEFIDREDMFTISFFDKKYKKALGICGSKSGRDCDKINEAGLTVGYDGDTPYINEAKLILICKKIYQDEIKPENFKEIWIDDNYPNKDYHTMYIGEIVKVLDEQ
ncbi:flavin reductase like protein [Mobilisporobacter senegalensis]|uniref:Flavin reductase like protein n=1 Tax=Mobilisporobacter senegalensis TaxID=1329262 RepID=A0A3N1XW02_9FIRM|nr:flavin reductase [Mobilisporobacter senegalensis]ROR30814.1 flavin reductase like protein [Mobilisporobacter senegalensis]